jgi:hypothetical protein
MRVAFRLVALWAGLALPAGAGMGQRPPDESAPDKAKADRTAVDGIVACLMRFDKNKDGKLTRDEITDPRLVRLFERADANKDGVVTRQELVVLTTQLADDEPPGGGRPAGRPGLNFFCGPAQVLDRAGGPAVKERIGNSEAVSQATNQGGALSIHHRPRQTGTRRQVGFRLIRSWVAPAASRPFPQNTR